MPTASWKDMCLPRNEGGLGIKQLSVWNRAAMGKHLWILMTKSDNLWVEWMRNKLEGKSIWSVSIPHDCSWACRKILQLRDSIKGHIEVKIGDGRETSFFLDSWLDGKSIVKRTRIPNCADQWGNMLQVSDWRTEGVWHVPGRFKRV